MLFGLCYCVCDWIWLEIGLIWVLSWVIWFGLCRWFALGCWLVLFVVLLCVILLVFTDLDCFDCVLIVLRLIWDLVVVTLDFVWCLFLGLVVLCWFRFRFWFAFSRFGGLF